MGQSQWPDLKATSVRVTPLSSESMRSLLAVVLLGLILQGAFCVDESPEADADGDDSKTGGGYNQFMNAVVNKKYVEDHLSGVVDWRRTATHSPNLAAVPPSQYRTFKKAQHGEDLDLYERYFKGKEKGLILESGAFDGYNVSTTLFFEKFANWSAVHIEADPGNFQKLSVNRPNSINVHMALCDEPRILHYVDTGITLAHGIAEFMPANFLRMHHPKLYRDRSLIKTLREVPCFPIKYLFRYLKITELDIWVLDTEGSELAVLKGVNFNRVKIQVIIMECDGHEPSKDQQKMEHLRERGYQCSRSQVTCFCKHDANVLVSELQPPSARAIKRSDRASVTSGADIAVSEGGETSVGRGKAKTKHQRVQQQQQQQQQQRSGAGKGGKVGMRGGRAGMAGGGGGGNGRGDAAGVKRIEVQEHHPVD